MSVFIETKPCIIHIDSNSRFSGKNCPRCGLGGPICVSTIINMDDDNSTKSILPNDEDYSDGMNDEDRYVSPITGLELPMYAMLPHRAYGFNTLIGELKNGWIYYKGLPVIALSRISKFFKENYSNDPVDDKSDMPCPCEEPNPFLGKRYNAQFYSFSVMYCSLDDGDDGDDTLYETVLYFDGKPVTDANVAIFVVQNQ